jgi:alpha-galactosidase
MDIVDMQVGIGSYAGPGHWNDPDMLEVGNGALTNTEYRSHFTMWCVLAAPLIAGNDLRTMTPETRDILTNKEVIAVDQDPLGREGARVWKEGDNEVWSKQMQDGSRTVVLLNRGAADTEISVEWGQIGYPDHLSAAVRDLWAHKDLGNFAGSFKAKVPSHGAVAVLVKP